MSTQTKMQIGLGEAIERHNDLHKRMTVGLASAEERAEYKLLSSALNEIKLDLGFDCDGDGVPDSIEIFMETSKTSCCRFVPLDITKSTKKTKSTSRATTSKK